MPEPVLAMIAEIGKTIVAHLFAGVLSGKAHDHLSTMRFDSAKQRTLVEIVDSLEPYFDKELSDDDQKIVLAEVKAATAKTILTGPLIAAHHYSSAELLNHIRSRHAADPELQARGLEGIYIAILERFCTSATVLAAALPEQDRFNWPEILHAVDDLSERLRAQTKEIEKMTREPQVRGEAFELTYRKYLENELRQIQLRGLGKIANVRTLSIDTAYVQPRFGRSSVRPQTTPPSAASGEIEELSRPSPESVDVRKALTIDEVFRQSRRVVIIGSPGSGKTTLVQYLALLAARREWSAVGGQPGEQYVPFILRVRSFSGYAQLPRPMDFVEICAQLLNSSAAERAVLDVLSEGRALVIVDGLDECEMPSRDQSLELPRDDARTTEWDRIIEWLQKLVSAFPRNLFLITSRPVAYSAGLLLTSGFAEFAMLPLNSVQQAEFIRKWCRAAEDVEWPNDAVVAVTRSERQAADLTERLDRTPSIRSFVDTPLMLAVLCIVHRYGGQQLPERRVALLGECIDVLLFEWRRAQGLKKSVIGDLNARDLRALLEPLAWEMSVRGDAETRQELVEEIFARTLPEIGQQGSRAKDVVALIRDRTGVLVEAANGVFAFAHLVLQEYLAAEYGSRGQQDILLEKTDDKRWKEIIPMAVAASRGSQETLIRGLLQKGSTLLAVRAVAAADRVSADLRRDVLDAIWQCILDSPNEEQFRALAEIGGDDPANMFVEAALRLPLAESGKLFEHVRDFDYGESVASAGLLGQRLAARCKRARDIGSSDWVAYRAWHFSIGYRGEKMGSWDGMSLAHIVPERANGLDTVTSSPLGRFDADPVYSYAVLLDSSPGFGIERIARAAKNAQERMSHEQRLFVAGLFLESHSAKRARAILDFIVEVPRDCSPAFQIGLLNAIEDESKASGSPLVHQIENFWGQCMVEVKNTGLELMSAWAPYLRVGTENDLREGSVDALKADFLAGFEVGLATGEEE
jgi:hypothetical protein